MHAERGVPVRVRQVAVTAGVLALVYLGGKVAIPGLDLDVLPASLTGSSFRLTALGLNPWIASWLVIEVLSLLPGPFRTWRRSGWSGRRRLDRVSMAVGLILSGVQAMGASSVFERLNHASGRPLVPNPGWGFRLLVVVTLVAATASLYWLGTVVSRWGIGNGFSVILAAQLLLSLWWEVRVPTSSTGDSYRLSLDGLFPQIVAALVVVVAVIAWQIVLERRRERAAPASWPVAFPQSVLAVPLAGILLSLLFGTGVGAGDWLGTADWVSRMGLNVPGIWLGCQMILVVLLSWLLFRLFSGARRLASELPISADQARARRTVLAKQARTSTVLLVAGSTGIATWAQFHPGVWSTTFDIVRIGLLVTVAWDLASQWRFTGEQGATAPLCQLNNVHLAPELVQRLGDAGIPATLQGFRHRALHFSYLPLVQIGVVVPRARLEEARALVSAMEIKVV